MVVGASLGLTLGDTEGFLVVGGVGLRDGTDVVGALEGVLEGFCDVGASVGALVGDLVGVEVVGDLLGF